MQQNTSEKFTWLKWLWSIRSHDYSDSVTSSGCLDIMLHVAFVTSHWNTPPHLRKWSSFVCLHSIVTLVLSMLEVPIFVFGFHVFKNFGAQNKVKFYNTILQVVVHNPLVKKTYSNFLWIQFCLSFLYQITFVFYFYFISPVITLIYFVMIYLVIFNSVSFRSSTSLVTLFSLILFLSVFLHFKQNFDSKFKTKKQIRLKIKRNSITYNLTLVHR